MKSIKMLLMAAVTILSVAAFSQDKTQMKNAGQKKENTKCSCTKCGCAKGACDCSTKTCKCSSCTKDKKVMTSGNESMKMYSCPMHSDVTSDKPGKCPKCGMALKASKEKTKHESMKMYSCPMHADVTSDKPGKCPKCGMALKEKN